jgi:hypothetical protein
VSPRGLTRQDLLKTSGATIGGLAVAGALLEPGEGRAALACEGNCYPPADEMRITFMGSTIPPTRRAQQMMSILVEVGWDPVRKREGPVRL